MNCSDLGSDPFEICESFSVFAYCLKSKKFEIFQIETFDGFVACLSNKSA